MSTAAETTPEAGPGSPPGAPTVTVRYWAAAREAAGTATERQAGRTVGGVLDAAVGRHPGLAGVVAACTVLVDGLAADRSARLEEGATVEVLPPFAGG
ncbi:MoaD/ThiS family protein [Intrasporangium sp.]|uniref:MoaD/ThiS family protein n=1 Tax=Intrasporangium sp. TaxID=1925024 RepID=UPI00322163E5